jgi:hypothetical protein
LFLAADSVRRSGAETGESLTQHIPGLAFAEAEAEQSDSNFDVDLDCILEPVLGNGLDRKFALVIAVAVQANDTAVAVDKRRLAAGGEVEVEAKAYRQRIGRVERIEESKLDR